MIRFLKSTYETSRSIKQIVNYFSNQKSKNKIQTIGFATKDIENVKVLGYKVKQKIEFEDGKFLLFRSSFSFSRKIRDYLIYIIGASLFGYLIYIRYNLDIAPTLLHVYNVSLFIVLFLWFNKFRKNQNIIKEIYLLQGGKATQIVFQNQFKRKLFGQPLKSTYYNSLLKAPQYEQDEMPSFNQFPQNFTRIRSKKMFAGYWKKRYSNRTNYLLIPKNFQYINRELLSQVMKGKVILS